MKNLIAGFGVIIIASNLLSSCSNPEKELG
jgi:hypothetical protein